LVLKGPANRISSFDLELETMGMNDVGLSITNPKILAVKIEYVPETPVSSLPEK
jgi:hypothetical protein